MSSSSLTVEVLNALLSPDGNQRLQAEVYWKSIEPDQRAPQLVQLLQQQQAVSHYHLQQLAAVLLRRDILVLSNLELLAQFRDILIPLLEKPGVGDCLAEICAVQTVFNESDSIHTMQTILNATAPAVSSKRWLY